MARKTKVSKNILAEDIISQLDDLMYDVNESHTEKKNKAKKIITIVFDAIKHYIVRNNRVIIWQFGLWDVKVHKRFKMPLVKFIPANALKKEVKKALKNEDIDIENEGEEKK